MVDCQLEDRGIETYFPYLKIDRGYGRGIRLEPFFPHYLFFKTDLTSAGAHGLQWLPGVRRIVHIGSRPATVPESIIEALRKRLRPYSDRALSKSEWLFKPGQMVVVTSGPFEGIEAVFQKSLNGRGRAQVLLQLVGTWTRAEIDTDHIKPLYHIHNPEL